MNKLEFCESFNVTEEEYEKIDKLCLPFIEFFNQQGLKTIMSCEGHDNSTMYKFWVSFSKEVTDEVVDTFIKKFPQPFYGQQRVQGKFVKINFGYTSDGKDLTRWRYQCDLTADYKLNQKIAQNDLKIFKQVLMKG